MKRTGLCIVSGFRDMMDIKCDYAIRKIYFLFENDFLISNIRLMIAILKVHDLATI